MSWILLEEPKTFLDPLEFYFIWPSFSFLLLLEDNSFRLPLHIFFPPPYTYMTTFIWWAVSLIWNWGAHLILVICGYLVTITLHTAFMLFTWFLRNTVVFWKISYTWIISSDSSIQMKRVHTVPAPWCILLSTPMLLLLLDSSCFRDYHSLIPLPHLFTHLKIL